MINHKPSQYLSKLPVIDLKEPTQTFSECPQEMKPLDLNVVHAGSDALTIIVSNAVLLALTPNCNAKISNAPDLYVPRTRYKLQLPL